MIGRAFLDRDVSKALAIGVLSLLAHKWGEALDKAT